MKSHLEGDSTKDLHSTKSAMAMPRNLLKDSCNQGESSHSKIKDAANRTEQTNSPYSKDDSWLPRTAKEKELNQLKHELPELKATLEKNNAALQELQYEQNVISSGYKKLVNIIGEKRALLLEAQLIRFQKALKLSEDGLSDIDPLKKNVETSEHFLQKLKRKGVNTQELEESLQSISLDITEAETSIKNQKTIKNFLDGVGLIKNKNGTPVDISSVQKIEIPQIKDHEGFLNSKSKALTSYQEFALKLRETITDPQCRTKMVQEALEKGQRCFQLNSAMREYLLTSVYEKFKDFPIKAHSKIGEQIDKLDKKAIDQLISDLEKNTNTALEKTVSSKRGKNQRRAKDVFNEKQEELEDKIKKTQDENNDLKKKIRQLEDPIAEYSRYNTKASKAEFEKGRDNLAKLYEQGGLKSIKTYLISRSNEPNDTRNNH